MGFIRKDSDKMVQSFHEFIYQILFPTHFVELLVIREGHNQRIKSKGMEDAHRYFIHDDEFMDLYTGLGANGT
jgi:hypothetical protein